MFIFSFICGLMLVIVTFALWVIEGTWDLSKNVLEFIFRLAPPFAFHFGVLNITNLNLFKLIFEYDK